MFTDLDADDSEQSDTNSNASTSDSDKSSNTSDADTDLTDSEANSGVSDDNILSDDSDDKKKKKKKKASKEETPENKNISTGQRLHDMIYGPEEIIDWDAKLNRYSRACGAPWRPSKAAQRYLVFSMQTPSRLASVRARIP